MGSFFKVHVHDDVCEEQARDGIPSPALHPPGRDDEGDVSFHAPGVPGVGDYHHGHVDRVGLCVDDIDDPEGLAGEGDVPRLLEEFRRRPEDVEDAVEIGEGVGDAIWCIEGYISRG